MRADEYFIHLLSCHLNGTNPVGYDVDWQEVLKYAQLHDLTGMVGAEINKIAKHYRPRGEVAEVFRQTMGRNLMEDGIKDDAVKKLITVLTAAKIPHMLVKGAVIKNLYPTPAFRTSGDIDVVVKPSDYESAIKVLTANGFDHEYTHTTVAALTYNSFLFEIHTELDSINVQTKIYFSTPFDDISERVGYTYKLTPLYHLIYVIVHFAHHLRSGGAGVRMIMDIDVMIRNYPNLNWDDFWHLCSNMQIGKTAITCIALSKKWFNTPVKMDYNFEGEDDDVFYNNLIEVIIKGGTFGFENGGVGKEFVMQSIGNDGKAGKKTTVKAMLKWIFPPWQYLAETRPYLKKHPFLLPVAWITRPFRAIRNRKKVKENVQDMVSSQKISERQVQVLNELGITVGYGRWKEDAKEAEEARREIEKRNKQN